MADIFVEKMVKKKRDGKDFARIALCVLLIVFSAVMSLQSPIFLALVLLFVLLGLLMMRICDVEYEYQYINGYFDVDKIFHKERRKNIFEANMTNLVILAPESAEALMSLASFRASIIEPLLSSFASAVSAKSNENDDFLLPGGDTSGDLLLPGER